MKMYVLVGEDHHETRIVLGVYTTQELAEAASRRYERRPYPEYHRFDSLEIERFEVNDEPVMV